MSPRYLVHVMGLCNLVAGALLVWRPGAVAPIDGVASPAALLFTRSAAVLLVAIAVAGWQMPANAVRSYLWTFGVGVKLAAAASWGAAASAAGVAGLWTGAAIDLAVALVIGVGLLRTRG